MARPRSPKSKTADAAKRDVEQMLDSLQEELERLRQEGAERAREAGRGAALVGTAGALGLVSVGALAALPLLALRRVLPGWLIAVLVAGAAARVLPSSAGLAPRDLPPSRPSPWSASSSGPSRKSPTWRASAVFRLRG